MNLAVCDACESIVKPGEFHRTGNQFKLGDIELRDAKYEVIISTLVKSKEPDLGATFSGFRPPIENLDLCWNCITKYLAEAVAKYQKPVKAKELASPDQ